MTSTAKSKNSEAITSEFLLCVFNGNRVGAVALPKLYLQILPVVNGSLVQSTK